MLRLRILPVALILAAVTGLAACNKDKPRNPAGDFAQRIEALPRAAARDTLRNLVDAAPPIGGLARFHLGNLYYVEAADSARSRGWNDPLVAAHLDSAETWFKAALAADSTMVPAYVNLGSLWDDRAEMMTSRVERDARAGQARVLYEQALALDPQNEKARCNLGTLFKRQNDMERAQREYLTVLEQNPRSALARYNLAILFATMRIYKEAQREFELAAKYDPQGDIGERSRANIQIIKDLMAAEASRAAKP